MAQEAELEVILHEQGYTYTGEESISSLTLPEIRRIQEGLRVKNQREANAQSDDDIGAPNRAPDRGEMEMLERMNKKID